MALPNLVIEPAKMLLDWGCAKLTGNEGFGVLMISHHPEGRRGHKFCYDTVEKALAVAKKQLQELWKDATVYVLCYDVTIGLPGGLQRGFLFEAEDRATGCQYRFFHGTAQSEEGQWAPAGEFIELPGG